MVGAQFWMPVRIYGLPVPEVGLEGRANVEERVVYTATLLVA